MRLPIAPIPLISLILLMLLMLLAPPFGAARADAQGAVFAAGTNALATRLL